MNFVYGADLNFGPVIKPYGARKKTHAHDEGLYVNAQELIDEVLKVLPSKMTGGT